MRNKKNKPVQQKQKKLEWSKYREKTAENRTVRKTKIDRDMRKVLTVQFIS